MAECQTWKSPKRQPCGEEEELVSLDISIPMKNKPFLADDTWLTFK